MATCHGATLPLGGPGWEYHLDEKLDSLAALEAASRKLRFKVTS